MHPSKDRSPGPLVVIAGSNAPFVGSLLADLTAAGHSVSSVATSEDALAAIATSHAVAALVDAGSLNGEGGTLWDTVTAPFSRHRPAMLVVADRKSLATVDVTRAFEADGTIVWPCDVEELNYRVALAIRERSRKLEGETRLQILSTEHQEAQRATAAKSAFLAQMSHEIRTPLNGIISVGDLLGESSLDTKQAQLVDTLKSSGEQLLSLINNVLDFSKIESGKMEIEARPFDLKRCATRAIDMFSARVANKSVELLAEFPPELPTNVVGDSLRLQQVLLNLIGNAIKFTSSGEVRLKLKPVQADAGNVRVQFEIIDSGMGIPAAARDKLFESFSQGRSGVAREFGGTGLGLAISRQLVSLMGGTLQFETEAGVGTRFFFTLSMSTVGEAAEPRADPLDGRSLLVLVSHEGTARMIETHARSWGMKVSVANSPKQVADADLAAPVDFVVVDEAMPDSLVHAVLDRVANRVAGPKTRVIVLQALHSCRDDSTAGDDLRITVLKPIKVEELHRQLATAISEKAVGSTRSPADELLQIGRRYPFRVLLVDDNEINLNVGLRMLRRVGLEADTADDGQKAVAAVQQGSYDLVFMDVQMPVMGGLDATRAIRSDEKFSEKPIIIAMTANSLAGDRERCIEAGMQDYLSKPMRPEDVEIKLREWGARLFTDGKVVSETQSGVASDSKSTTPAAADAVDMERLEYFSAGDQDAMRDIVSLYFQQAEKQLMEIFESIKRGEPDRVRSVSHTCVGASATCGVNRILSPLRELERMGQSGKLDSAGRCLQDARGALEEARLFLHAKGCI